MIKNIRKNVNKIKEKKGAFSIIAVALIFIAVMALTVFLDMLSKTYTLNEVQSIMDTVGDSALKTVVSSGKGSDAMKEGRLTVGNSYIDVETKQQSVLSGEVTSTVKNTYLGLISQSLGSNSNVVSFTPTFVDVYMENSTYGLGVTSKARPQLILDVTANVKIKTSNYFNSNQVIEQFYYNGKKDSKFVVTYQGQKDGISELVIRSVNRLVLR